MPIDIKRLKKLNSSISFCETEYNELLEDSLDIPEEIKDAWRNYSQAKKYFKSILKKYDIN